MAGIITLITILLAIIYIRLKLSLRRLKDEDLINTRSYPCYINIILSLSIAINNIARFFNFEKGKFLCHFQALILVIFDKLIFTTITVNSYLTYKGLSDNESYINNIKKYFFITNSIGLAISVGFGVGFLCQGTVDYDGVCYVKGGPTKEGIDSVVMIILYCIFFYSNLKSILFLLRNIKELYLRRVNITAYLFHFYRIFVSILLSSFAFLASILIINDSLFMGFEYIDLCFISTCLGLDLFYSLNITVLKEIGKLFCCKEEDRLTSIFDDNEEHGITINDENI